jgi:hypothetical protein
MAEAKTTTNSISGSRMDPPPSSTVRKFQAVPMRILGWSAGSSQRISGNSALVGMATQPRVGLPVVTCRKKALPAPGYDRSGVRGVVIDHDRVVVVRDFVIKVLVGVPLAVLNADRCSARRPGSANCSPRPSITLNGPGSLLAARGQVVRTNEYVRSLVDRAGVMACGVHQNPAITSGVVHPRPEDGRGQIAVRPPSTLRIAPVM